MEAYRPKDYWEQRLGESFDLTGVGHHEFPDQYNTWVYRRKANALADALDGVPAGCRALDIGSGVGWVVQELQGRGLQADGCDITEVAVARLRERFPGEFFKVSVGAEPIPAADGSYDVVTMLDVAYHITDDQLWRATLTDLARVLAPGGLLVVTDRLDPETVQAAEHVRFRSLNDWAKAAADADLRIDRVEALYRWLSRQRTASGWRHVPMRLRGPLEYALDRLAPTPPHLRIATFTKQ